MVKKRVSVIILNYNGHHFLKTCIPTILNQTYPHIEIIVADNNSSDQSIEFLKKNYPKVKTLIFKENYGFAKGNNLAVKEATGEFLLILNNDTELFPDCIERLIKMHKPQSILTPRQIPINDKKSPGRTGGGVDIFGYPYLEFPIENTKIFYADGNGLFLLTSDFKKIGGFDDLLFMFQEDIDFSWRAHLMGYTIIPCWESKMYHYFGGTATMEITKSQKYTSSYFRRYHNEKNIIRNILKNYSLPFIIPIIIILLTIHIGEIIFLGFLFQWKVIQCYFKAYEWNIRNLQNTITIRRTIQKKRVVSDFSIIKNMYWVYSKIIVIFRIGIPHFN